MTKGATTAGNALTLYNTTIKPETYSLGDEIKVTLRKESAKMQVYNSAPQISGFDAAEVEKISSGNNVQPVTITVDKLLDFACMPVKIENVTIETAGIWKPEDNKATHTFKANGSDLTVYINKGASSFNNVAYIAKENGSLTGIAAAYKTSAQLLPRNLEDVKEFEATGPTITSVAPSQVNFPSTGGEETLIISTSNQGSSTLQLSPLGEGISAEVIDNNTVKVKAEANTSTNEIKKDLVISLSGGNSVTVPIKVAAIGGSNGYKLIETVADLSEGKYFMAGYAEISNDKTDLKPYTYQIWQGTLSSSDLVTVAYQYQGDELIAKDASQVAAEMELVKIDGKADTYYIKIGDQYLYNPSKATNRKLKLKDTADESVEWKFEDKNNGGVTASNNEVYLVTANADSKFIRSYKSSSISSLKGIFFFVLYAFKSINLSCCAKNMTSYYNF